VLERKTVENQWKTQRKVLGAGNHDGIQVALRGNVATRIKKPLGRLAARAASEAQNGIVILGLRVSCAGGERQ